MIEERERDGREREREREREAGDDDSRLNYFIAEEMVHSFHNRCHDISLCGMMI